MNLQPKTSFYSTEEDEESIVVYSAHSEKTYSSISRDSDLDSELNQSILISKNIDIEDELKKVEAADDDSLFKVLSMNFYSSRVETNTSNDNFKTKLTLGESSPQEAGQLRGLANLGKRAEKKFSKDYMFRNFFDFEKTKPKNGGLAVYGTKQENGYGLGREKSQTAFESNKVSCARAVCGIGYRSSSSYKQKNANMGKKREESPKPKNDRQTEFRKGHKDNERRANDEMRLKQVNSKKATKRNIAERRPQNTFEPRLAKLKFFETMSGSSKVMSTESYSTITSDLQKSPKIKGNTAKNDLSRHKAFNMLISNKGETTPTASTTSFFERYSFLNSLESKRTTVEQVSYPQYNADSHHNNKVLKCSTNQSMDQFGDEPNKTNSCKKRLTLKDMSHELTEQKNYGNQQGEKGMYLFFDIPEQSSVSKNLRLKQNAIKQIKPKTTITKRADSTYKLKEKPNRTKFYYFASKHNLEKAQDLYYANSKDSYTPLGVEC